MPLVLLEKLVLRVPQGRLGKQALQAFRAKQAPPVRRVPLALRVLRVYLGLRGPLAKWDLPVTLGLPVQLVLLEKLVPQAPPALLVVRVLPLYGTSLERTVAVLRMLSETLPHMMAKLGIGLTPTVGMLGIRHRRERSGLCWQVLGQLDLLVPQDLPAQPAILVLLRQ